MSFANSPTYSNLSFFLTNELKIRFRKRSAAESGLVVESVSRLENFSARAIVTAPVLLLVRLQELPAPTKKIMVKIAKVRNVFRNIFPPNYFIFSFSASTCFDNSAKRFLSKGKRD